MSALLFMRRVGDHLAPIDAGGEAVLAAVPDDAVVKVELKRPRNLGHHRKYWALLNAVYPHQELYPTLDSFAAAMKVATGLAEPVRLPNGTLIFCTGSIAFGRMDQAAFEQFYRRAVNVVLTRILPGVDAAHLEAQVLEILQGE